MEAPLAVATALDAVASITPGGMPLEMAGLLALLSDVQVLRNRLDGLVNDVVVAVARVDDDAMREEFPQEEFGTDFVGRVALHSQAPELVAPCLGVSVHVAQSRVVTAVDLEQRAPLLVAEMREGRLEAFRAGLLHRELSDAPAPVEDEIVMRLVARADRLGGWSETAGPLVRRARSLLARLAPQVVAARVAASRELRGLHKRGESESLDRWDGLYHVEDSRMAWAAIDEVAQQILRSGAADTLAQARADAHMQLLLEHCDVTVHLHATATAEQLAEQLAAQPAAAAAGAGAGARASAAASQSAARARSATPSASTTPTPEADTAPADGWDAEPNWDIETEPPPPEDWAAAGRESEWTPEAEWPAEPGHRPGQGQFADVDEPEWIPATEWAAEPAWAAETEPPPPEDWAAEPTRGSATEPPPPEDWAAARRESDWTPEVEAETASGDEWATESAWEAGPELVVPGEDWAAAADEAEWMPAAVRAAEPTWATDAQPARIEVWAVAATREPEGTPEAGAEPAPSDEWAAEPTLDVENEPEPEPAAEAWAATTHDPEWTPATEWAAEPTLETEPEPAAQPARPSAPAADSEVGSAVAPVVEVGGFGGPGTMLIRSSWLTDALAAGRAVLDAPVRCHPDTGAILDGAIAKGFTRATTRTITGSDAEPRYRMPEPMARLVRFRDRHCRFPGCAINSRFCDLDHVTPWPDGPTSPANLMALCRRHHRLKQTPGWRVAIHPDLTVTWTDPIGRTHTSYPSDHLGLTDEWKPLPEKDFAAPARDSTLLNPAASNVGEFSPLEAHLARLLAA